MLFPLFVTWKRSSASAPASGTQFFVTVTVGSAFSVFVMVQLPVSPRCSPLLSVQPDERVFV